MDSWVQAESGLTLTVFGLADSDSDSDPLDSDSDSDSDSGPVDSDSDSDPGPVDSDSHLLDSDSGLMDSDSDSGLVDSDSLPDSRVRTHSNTAYELLDPKLVKIMWISILKLLKTVGKYFVCFWHLRRKSWNVFSIKVVQFVGHKTLLFDFAESKIHLVVETPYISRVW